MKKILVPTDFSAHANNAYRYALQLAATMNAEVIVYNTYLVATSISPYSDAELMLAMQQIARETADAKFRRYKREAKLLAPEREIALSLVVEMGFASTAICEYAQQHAIDLVVMGTRGETNIFVRTFGGVTADVIHRATCPVLAVPPKATYKRPHIISYANDKATAPSYQPATLRAFANSIGSSVENFHIPEDETDISVALKRHVADFRTDMLAMTTHNRSFWEWLFHRSLTEKLAYQSRVPLLALHDE